MNQVYFFRPSIFLIIHYHVKFHLLFPIEFYSFFQGLCIPLWHMPNQYPSFEITKAVKIKFLFFLFFQQYFSIVLMFSLEASLFKVLKCSHLLIKLFFFSSILLITTIIVWISILVCDILIDISLPRRRKDAGNSLIQ